MIMADYTLEERLAELSKRVCDPGCAKCKGAKLTRLEARARAHASAKRTVQKKSIEFHDASPGILYPPSGGKRRRTESFDSPSQVISSWADDHSRASSSSFDFLDSPASVCAPSISDYSATAKTAAHSLVLGNAKRKLEDEDELKRAKQKLSQASETTTPQSVATQTSVTTIDDGPIDKSATGTRAWSNYLYAVANVDVATLKSHKSCFDAETTEKRIHERLESSKQAKQVEMQPTLVPALDTAVAAVTTSETPQPLELPQVKETPVSTQTVESEPPVKEAPVAEEPKPETKAPEVGGGLFGANTLQLFSQQNKGFMGEGNPLFAPGYTSTALFTQTPDVAKGFVFGSQTATTAPAPNIQVQQMQQQQQQRMQQQMQMQMPVIVPQVSISIPGFEAPAPPPVNLASNPFTAPMNRGRRGRGPRSRTTTLD